MEDVLRNLSIETLIVFIVLFLSTLFFIVKKIILWFRKAAQIAGAEASKVLINKIDEYFKKQSLLEIKILSAIDAMTYIHGDTFRGIYEKAELQRKNDYKFIHNGGKK